jgi:lycopene cyclase domain-containing protein
MFNELFTMDLRLAHLPIEEILFFITVPFACLFTWEMIKKNIPDFYVAFGDMVQILAYIMPLAGVLLFINGKEYTGLVMFALSLAIMVDKFLATNLVYQKRFYWYLGVIIILTLIFNGYLTARPVVLYGESYQLGMRVFTIPVEDFGYGISLLFLCTILYEKFKTIFLTDVKRVNT